MVRTGTPRRLQGSAVRATARTQREFERPEDGFRRSLTWSAAAHSLVIAGLAVSANVGHGPALLPASAAFVELGMSGPSPTPSLGSAPPAETTAPEPVEAAPPESPPEPAAEPTPSRPEVARPTAEDRDRMPVPEARTRRREPRVRPDSGLRGRDAAWAKSAPLTNRRPIDTKSRPTPRRAARTGTSGSGSGGIGLGGAPGGTRFDQDFEYSYYQRQMIARIQANWQQIPVRGEQKVVIRFTIHRSGAISGAEVETSSGQPLLDRAAYRAVVLAEPMPPLPESYPRDQVGVHLLFTYSRTSSTGPDQAHAGAEATADEARAP